MMLETALLRFGKDLSPVGHRGKYCYRDEHDIDAYDGAGLEHGGLLFNRQSCLARLCRILGGGGNFTIY